MQPDFSLIYSELGLRPDCSLVEFKRAYLRRIGELHPDRHGGAPATSDAQAVLTDLIAAYVAVCRFQRRYGRMPGAGRGGPCLVAYSGAATEAVGSASTRDEAPQGAPAAAGRGAPGHATASPAAASLAATRPAAASHAAAGPAPTSSMPINHTIASHAAGAGSAPSRSTRRLLVVFLALLALLVSWDWLTL